MARAIDVRRVAEQEPAPGPLSYHLDADGRLHRGLEPQALARAFRSGRGQLWVDIDSDEEPDWQLLTDLFGFHPLAIEDTASPECRVKIEEYDGYLFVVVRGIRLASWTAEPYDLDATNLYLFIGAHFLVTVHQGRSRPVEAVADRLEAGGELLRRGVERVAHRVCDELVDLYFPVLDEIDDFVDELEDRVVTAADEGLMGRIFQLRRTLVALRRHLGPMREVVGTIANRPSSYLRTDAQIYFRDVYDHVIRQIEMIELERDRLNGVVETHLSIISNRTNQVMKSLSVVATLVLPATLVASVYGMNFEWMPGLESSLGFWFAVLGMAAISGGFLLYLWWKGWI